MSSGGGVVDFFFFAISSTGQLKISQHFAGPKGADLQLGTTLQQGNSDVFWVSAGVYLKDTTISFYRVDSTGVSLVKSNLMVLVGDDPWFGFSAVTPAGDIVVVQYCNDTKTDSHCVLASYSTSTWELLHEMRTSNIQNTLPDPFINADLSLAISETDNSTKVQVANYSTWQFSTSDLILPGQGGFSGGYVFAAAGPSFFLHSYKEDQPPYALISQIQVNGAKVQLLGQVGVDTQTPIAADKSFLYTAGYDTGSLIAFYL